MPKVLRLD